MDDTLRALHEILLERLGAAKIVYNKHEKENVDFYLFEETLESNVNEKRKALRRRRDVMGFIKAQVKQQAVGKDSTPGKESKDASVEKEALSEAVKKFTLQSRCTKDIFDYFLRSK